MTKSWKARRIFNN